MFFILTLPLLRVFLRICLTILLLLAAANFPVNWYLIHAGFTLAFLLCFGIGTSLFIWGHAMAIQSIDHAITVGHDPAVPSVSLIPPILGAVTIR